MASADNAATLMSSASSKVCYNSECKQFIKPAEKPRKGWRLRTGECCELCDRCACAYEEGSFCETFHLNASGWRLCESCGKRIHCGCIVSAYAFTLLNPGGIECMSCARKNITLAPHPIWTPPLLVQSSLPDRLKDLSVKNLEGKKKEDFSERVINGSLGHGAWIINKNGNAGIKREDKPGVHFNVSPQSTLLKQDSFAPQFGIAVPYTSPNESNGEHGVLGIDTRQTHPPSTATQFYSNLYNGNQSSSEIQILKGKPLGDPRVGNHLLPRYAPRFTCQGLLQTSVDSHSVVTPLFEKTLSASDAGRIGRLVLPKKCAEAYFPPISHPEGLPLKVHDTKGTEWTFQFRFWPNNNSRMYVLEGVTSCLQSLQLKAGDIVTFSRLGPQGKLTLGFRKASTAPNQETETGQTANGVSPNEDDRTAMTKSGEGAKSLVSRKRKNSSTLGYKSKRPQMEEEMMELKLTWEEAQGLLRPPPNHIQSIVVIEGFNFEEFEDPPVLGRPTIIPPDNAGEKIQWVRCEDCSKWRKLPVNALLPVKWTCSDNSWDPERSICSAAQELTTEQLEELLSPSNSAASKKMKGLKQETNYVESPEGVDTLANLAAVGDDEPVSASAQPTTKHPRHRPGCSCIVCIQPPSGKGPKHEPTCACPVCQTVKRRFNTLMARRDQKKQSGKETGTTHSIEPPALAEKPVDDNNDDDDESILCSHAVNSSPSPKRAVDDWSDNDLNKMETSTSPFKARIDLNIQPEREEELSTSSDSGIITKLPEDGSNIGDRVIVEDEKHGNGIDPGDNHRDSDKDHPATTCIKMPSSIETAMVENGTMDHM